MSEPGNLPSLLGKALLDAIRLAVREEIKAAMGELNGHGVEDRLLGVGEASRLLGMSRHWLYRHATKLPFTRKIGPNLRFSSQGIKKYLSTRKTSQAS